MLNLTPHCLACNGTDAEVPLIKVLYQGKDYWICPQHLPILIHKPQQLAGALPGIEKLGGADHNHA